MSLLAGPDPVTAPGPSRSTGRSGLVGLIAAEWRRMRSRRVLRLVVLTAVIGYLMVVPAVALTQYARITPQALAEAAQRRDAVVAQVGEQRATCLAAARGVAVKEQACPVVPTAAELGPVEQFLAKQAFLPSEAHGPVLTALLLIAALACYLVGASWVGSDLSSRTMATLLTWEPRRSRLFAVRVGVLVAAVATAGLNVTTVWTASAAAMARWLGRNDLTAHGWWLSVAGAGPSLLLMLVLALLGLGAAFLTRGTAAALTAVVAELVLELLVRSIFPSWQPWLPTVNATALLSPNGTVVSYPQEWVAPGGSLQDRVHVAISSGQGAAFLVGLTAVVLTLAWVTWTRRDVT